MNAQPFCVTAGLQTPVILTTDAYLTLDSLLGAAVFARTGEAEAAVQEIPLAQTDGIFHGSAGFLDSVLLKAPGAGFKLGIQPTEEMWLPAYQTGTSEDKATGRKFRNNKRLVRRVDTVRGEYSTTLDAYSAFAAAQITWFGCGEMKAVRDLLGEITSVGKKSRQGWGAIVGFHLEEIDVDLSLSRQRRGMDRPMRPIPAATWQAWGRDITPALLTRECAVRPPYFCGPKIRCVVPATRDLKGA